MNHPAIVQVYDILEGPSGDSLVMEFVEGRSLSEVLATDGVDVETALRLAGEIGEGVSQAHAAGLLHRDLKSENVMVTSAGRAKVLDFGLAKWTHSEAGSALTREGGAVGTIRAMSPEQVEGRPVDARTDLFALGVLLYEMLVGRSPFAEGTDFETYRRILDKPPIPLDAWRPELPRPLCRWVEGLLSKAPEDRPASARDVVETLQGFSKSGEVVGLGPPTSREPEAIPSDAPTLGRTLPGAGPAPPPRQEASAARPSRRWLAGLAILGAIVLLASVGIDLWSPPGEVQASGGRGDVVTPLPRTPHDLFVEGSRLLARYDRQGYLERAIEAFEGAIALDSHYAPAYSGLGRAHWRQHRYKRDPARLQRAFENARQAVRLAPQLTHGRVTLAWVRIARGEYEEAHDELDAVLELESNNTDARRGLAELAAVEGRIDDAIEGFRAAIEIDPEDWNLEIQLGIMLSRVGRYPEAQAAYERALALVPDHHFVLLSLGGLHHLQGRPAKAAEALQRSIEVRPTGVAYSNLGTLYFFEGRYLEAAAAYRQAVELNANNYLLWAHLGDAYRQVPGQEEAATEAFLRAIQLAEERLAEHPGDVELASRRVLYRARTGDCSIRATGSTASSHYRAGLARELCGDRDGAFVDLEAALEEGYSFAEVRQEPDLIALREDLRFHHLALRFGKPPSDP